MNIFTRIHRLITLPVSMMASLIRVVLLISFVHSAQADGEVDIRNINVTPVGTATYKYKVDGDIFFQLTDTLRKALTHGVTLKANIEITLGEHRVWWWNSSKTLSKISYELKYHALSKHYVLTRLDNNKRWNFTNLPISLKQMGRLREHRLPTLPAEIKDGNHYLYITAMIVAETRSLPFKIQHYFKSSKYQIKSEGVLWALP